MIDALQKLYVQPLQRAEKLEACGITREQSDVLFSNLGNLASLNAKFLEALTKRLPDSLFADIKDRLHPVHLGTPHHGSTPLTADMFHAIDAVRVADLVSLDCL